MKTSTETQPLELPWERSGNYGVDIRSAEGHIATFEYPDHAEFALRAVNSHNRLKAIIDEQAADGGLWFIPHTAPEAYLMQELRKLHAAFEGVSPEECARAAIAQAAPTPTEG